MRTVQATDRRRPAAPPRRRPVRRTIYANEMGVGALSVQHSPRFNLREWMKEKGLADIWNPSVRGTDLGLILIVTALLAIGLVMVYSAALRADTLNYGNLDLWFIKQLRWVGLGLVVLFFCWRIRYTFWKKLSIWMMLGSLGLLLLVVLLGHDRFGAARSILKSGSIQPSELVKLAMTIYMAHWMTSKGERLQKFGFGLVPFAILLGTIAGLVVAQPARSTMILLVLTAIAMFFVAGANWKQFSVLVLVGVGSGVAIIRAAEYARVRLQGFLQTWRNPLESAQQQTRDFVLSLQSGGFTGLGLANGVIKKSIALSHSDSIFAVIGEEFGLLGCLVLITFFVLLYARGLRIARRSPDAFGYVLSFGLTCWMVLQAFMHIAVATVTIPTTGVPLTFISYGGSSMLVSMAAVGILLSISCSVPEEGQEQSAATAQRGWNRWTRLPHIGDH